MEGGRVLMAVAVCRAREGEGSPCRKQALCPCVEPAQALPCCGAPLPPSFPCSKTLPRALAQHPLPSPMSSAAGRWESWDPRAGLGEREAAEELPGGSGLQGGSCLPLTGSGAAGIPGPAFLLGLFFPSSFPPLSHLLSLRLSRLQPCLLGERRCPHPAAGGRCSIAPYGYRSFWRPEPRSPPLPHRAFLQRVLGKPRHSQSA